MIKSRYFKDKEYRGKASITEYGYFGSFEIEGIDDMWADEHKELKKYL